MTNKLQIPIPQIQNKSQRKLFGILHLDHCDLFVLWNLLFGVFHDILLEDPIVSFLVKLIVYLSEFQISFYLCHLTPDGLLDPWI